MINLVYGEGTRNAGSRQLEEEVGDGDGTGDVGVARLGDAYRAEVDDKDVEGGVGGASSIPTRI